MRTAYLMIAFAFLTTQGCRTSNKNDKLLENLQRGLVRSNHIIQIGSHERLKRLEDEQYNTVTAEKAKIWYPIAKNIADIADNTYKYLDSLIIISSFNENEIQEIIEKLKRYERKLLTYHEKVEKEFSYQSIFQNDSINIQSHKIDLNNNNMQRISSVLHNYKNHFARLENNGITFCSFQYSTHTPFYDNYSFIIGQNTQIIKPGENLEITAGIGVFSKSSQPKIKINNHNFEINDAGYVRYDIKVSQKTGNYKVPIEIEYLDFLTGKKEVKIFTVDYTVAKECNE